MHNKRIRAAARAVRTANTAPSRRNASENIFPGATAGIAKFSEYLNKLPKTEQNN